MYNEVRKDKVEGVLSVIVSQCMCLSVYLCVCVCLCVCVSVLLPLCQFLVKSCLSLTTVRNFYDNIVFLVVKDKFRTLQAEQVIYCLVYLK